MKPTHPIKPLVLAQTIFNAAAEGGTYEAVLSLHFDQGGRDGLADALTALAEAVPEGVTPQALFGRPSETAP